MRRALERGLAAAQQERAKVVDATRAERAKIWNEFVAYWKSEHARLLANFRAADAEQARLFPDWNAPSWDAWTAPEIALRKMLLGDVALDVRSVTRDFTPHADLPLELPQQWRQPALIDFPRSGSLIIQADGEGREAGLRILQALALRLLTSLPPGKARFTIIDPVGLGKNFAGMMHLADYDDALVTNRIWTETQHIEQRLLDLSEQIEVIIQKYLRNEYSSIDEYNAVAGEVAEPFRFLIVANFPRNFTEAAARRLLSIAASGPRCGVYVLLMADTEQKMPAGFSLNDLAKYGDSLIWEKNRFVWRDDTFGAAPFTPLDAPNDDVVTKLVHLAGEASKDAKRVEVPFTTICPSPERYWTGSTQASFDIALGRAGARKLQHMRLGYGTSQHVLIAGKTGSGKSSLLHALIVNAALTYSPDELEFYLIDFKKGVEFKDYAIFGLPHARVIAIESEREFGLSVLQRLDTEMQARGELFRAAGKQDLNGYRGGEGAQPLPRILLVIDEFQEFFTEEDRVSQAATLLLDRLVRQGRAFGIHLLLGSQTLGGAYSLAQHH
ncbi:MAG: FtsK/SpoIIIE domain-containing protein [Pirellulales bacterium]